MQRKNEGASVRLPSLADYETFCGIFYVVFDKHIFLVEWNGGVGGWWLNGNRFQGESEGRQVKVILCLMACRH